MLSWEIRLYRAALRLGGRVIFDRGLPIPPHVDRAAHIFRDHRRVFVAPPWPEIFTPDAERKQSFEQAQATYEAMVETYSALARVRPNLSSPGFRRGARAVGIIRPG